ncbi:rhomboid family intramembrane serine protease [Flammeovirga yaeyamensis]|uniref:Rhomboid family intramembrane serine protease n=1 Tax=Flammeovirga yaeyamensis TaxID=367791 RepID=A0AAX1N8J1_9BACT|nr:rhomboid family intramembrane serine protease [Flammeovirga yaeyamensis]MBB3701471.1 membrane associated rhomboid family serine protease [Flammeovirga yaeyamensis]NMF38596.1 rhomboid family intramembrane serine protease [Flammeovirga yaeyamensis]QWG02741.1 rhomboid family intramembrane serine protease [Flammeovirga yaeyamensis]
MNGFISDLKYTWNKPGSGLLRLIIINVIIFVVMSLLNVLLTFSGYSSFFEMNIYENLALPSEFTSFLYKPWTLVTYFFVHSMKDFFHILMNMLILYWFGMIFTEFLGDKKAVILYFLGGLMGGIVYLLIYNLIPYFDGANAVVVGASGSVLAIVVGAATIAPDYRINLLFIGPVKIKWLAAFYVVMSISGLTGGNAGGQMAHLGGIIMGFTYVKMLQKGTDLGAPFYAIENFFDNLLSPKKNLKVVYRRDKKSKSKTKAGKENTDQPTQSRVDEILDKISDKGYEGLTQEEKQILFKASQRKH